MQPPQRIAFGSALFLFLVALLAFGGTLGSIDDQPTAFERLLALVVFVPASTVGFGLIRWAKLPSKQTPARNLLEQWFGPVGAVVAETVIVFVLGLLYAIFVFFLASAKTKTTL